jgi:hypothetical protein
LSTSNLEVELLSNTSFKAAYRGLRTKTELGWGPKGLAGAQRRLVILNLLSRITVMHYNKRATSVSSTPWDHLTLTFDKEKEKH